LHEVDDRSTQQKEESMNAERIEGAFALVTGANRGIGRALTEAVGSSPKTSERQVAAMPTVLLLGSAA